MTREEELFRDACARLAQEETEELSRSMTAEEDRRAEEIYRHHRPSALFLIRRHTRRQGARGRALAAAAAAAVLFGAAYLALSRTPPDSVPAAQPPTASVAPYYSPVPTETEIPALESAITPTEPEKTAIIEAETPTMTPTPAATNEPTEAPAMTPQPTATPTPAPTEAPEEMYSPAGWTGLFFPQRMPEGSEMAYLSQENGRHTAAYTLNGMEILFTEYDAPQTLAVPEGAEVRYAPLENGVIALRAETDAGVTFIWDQDGRTFAVACEKADAEAIASSVKKLADE